MCVYLQDVGFDELTFSSGMWIIVDTDTPSLGRVYVYGGLEFEDSRDHVFNATIIFLQVGFHSDSPLHPSKYSLDTLNLASVNVIRSSP